MAGRRGRAAHGRASATSTWTACCGSGCGSTAPGAGHAAPSSSAAAAAARSRRWRPRLRRLPAQTNAPSTPAESPAPRRDSLIGDRLDRYPRWGSTSGRARPSTSCPTRCSATWPPFSTRSVGIAVIPYLRGDLAVLLDVQLADPQPALRTASRHRLERRAPWPCRARTTRPRSPRAPACPSFSTSFSQFWSVKVCEMFGHRPSSPSVRPASS